MICNGNGACFNYDVNSPMCPSYKLMRDRRNSPKGRATMAREWLRELQNLGFDPRTEEDLAGSTSLSDFFARIVNSWKRRSGEYDFSNEVMEVMSECLACKACSSQCPVKVDIANFRSRFLYMYHRRYRRPWKDYCVATIESTAPLMAKFPRTVNLLLQNPLAGFMSGKTIGVVDLPALSYPTLSTLVKQLELPVFSLEAVSALTDEQKSRTVLFVQDPFTTCYEADVVRDLLKFIKQIGYTPYVLPFKPNGKAQHVRGFLGMFAKTAENTAQFLNSVAALNIPMIGLDPAMVICYRDEYKKILKDRRGDFKVLLLQEWLLSVLERVEKPAAQCDHQYYLLAHCQEKTFKPSTHNDWVAIFKHFGVSLKPVAVGCCGMAGMYGHEAVHLESSTRIYRQSFGAAIGKYGIDNCAVTGYSCRSQVKRQEGRKVKHPVQILTQWLEKQKTDE